jgi:hypothetical protein
LLLQNTLNCEQQECTRSVKIYSYLQESSEIHHFLSWPDISLGISRERPAGKIIQRLNAERKTIITFYLRSKRFKTKKKETFLDEEANTYGRKSRRRLKFHAKGNGLIIPQMYCQKVNFCKKNTSTGSTRFHPSSLPIYKKKKDLLISTHFSSK